MKTFKIIAALVFAFLVRQGMAQQQAIFTQYMFNILSVNPAYTGSHEALSFTGLTRWQWQGVEGAPNTQTFTVHSPLRNKRIALGAFFMNDNIGVARNTTVNFSAAYRIPTKRGYASRVFLFFGTIF